MRAFKRFLKADEGAVTVDWVVLTAAVVGLAVAVSQAVMTGTINASDGIGDALAELIDAFGVDNSTSFCDSMNNCIIDSDGDGVADLGVDADGNETDLSELQLAMSDLDESFTEVQNETN